MRSALIFLMASVVLTALTAVAMVGLPGGV